MKKKLVKTLLLIILLLLGAVLGKVVATACEGVDYLSWLAISAGFGFSPVTIDLAVLKFTIGFMMDISVAQIILLLIAILAYTKIKIKE